MTAAPSRIDRAALATGAVLTLTTALAWLLMLRGRATMVMPDATPTLAHVALFTLQWGVMMTAMMLPSAAPMILFYRKVRAGMTAAQAPVISASLFAAVYLLLWLLTGVPVYAASVANAQLAEGWPAYGAAQPYLLAAIIGTAGLYQVSSLKKVCLKYCESPLSFLMQRWRGGYVASLRIAVAHATYCIACCWALMVILVAAGAMGMPWVLAITVAVVAEKVLPRGWRTARVIGAALILLAIAVTVRPSLAGTMRGAAPMVMEH